MSNILDKMGKHPFDPEKASTFIKYLREGSFQETAADLARTPLPVLNEWGTRGLLGESEVLVEFYQGVRKALAEYEAELVANVRAASKRDWRAASYLLSERFSERWAGKHEPEKKVGKEEELSDRQKAPISDFIDSEIVTNKVMLDEASADEAILVEPPNVKKEGRK